MVVGWLFLAVPWGCLRFVIVVFPGHTHLLFLRYTGYQNVIKDHISHVYIANSSSCTTTELSIILTSCLTHGLQSRPPSPKRAERKVRRRPFREAGSGQNNGTR